MIKNKCLFKNISIFLCLVPMLLLSLFCLVPNNQDFNVSAADDTITPYTFYGSNLNLCASTIDTNESDHDVSTFIDVNISFGYSNNDFTWRVNGTLVRPGLTDVRTFDNTGGINNYLPVLSRPNQGFYVCNLPTLENTRYAFFYYVLFSGRNSFVSSDIVKVVIGSSTINALGSSSGYISNYISYYDNNDRYITFGFARYAPNYGTSSDVFSAFDLEERTYYLTLSNLGDGSIYQNGYTNGYNDGLSEGQDLGYNEGYNVGVDIGYGNGYNDGIEQGGNYTFLRLMGAVVDAPITAFKSLLNFELLGFDILAFVTGLLTLALIIFVVKLILGGK